MSLASRLEEVREQAICSTCGNSYDPGNIQETHPYRHPVNGPVRDASQDKQSESKSQPRLPSDPILRLVLIEKGLITVDDLNEAEARLKASGMAIAGESNGE